MSSSDTSNESKIIDDLFESNSTFNLQGSWDDKLLLSENNTKFTFEINDKPLDPLSVFNFVFDDNETSTNEENEIHLLKLLHDEELDPVYDIGITVSSENSETKEEEEKEKEEKEKEKAIDKRLLLIEARCENQQHRLNTLSHSFIEVDKYNILQKSRLNRITELASTCTTNTYRQKTKEKTSYPIDGFGDGSIQALLKANTKHLEQLYGNEIKRKQRKNPINRFFSLYNGDSEDDDDENENKDDRNNASFLFSNFSTCTRKRGRDRQSGNVPMLMNIV